MKNNWLAAIGSNAAKTAGKAEFMIKKKSPEILLGLGIVAFVGTVVAACNATSRADEVLEFHKKKVKDIHDAKEIADANPEEELSYEDEVYRMDLGIRYLKTTGSLVKLYAPSVALGTLSIACILASRNIMQKRYLGMVAAYNSLSIAFGDYRKRVIETEGTGADRYYRYGAPIKAVPTGEIEKDPDTGKKIKQCELQEQMDSSLIPSDDTCRFFDSSNPNWDKNPTFSMMWLRGQQNILNDLLHTRGHVFLNEVYDALGFPHTPQGAVLGWLDGEGDDCIDFGLYDAAKDGVRRFVNGEDNVIMLEFNHDGPIWDRI